MGFRFGKVMLIFPAYPGNPYANQAVWPLGLGYIAEALKQHGIDYKVLDLRFGYGVNHLFNRIRDYRPDLIGVSLTTLQYKRHYAFLQSIRDLFPGTPIVVGGPHVATMQEKVLGECEAIDYGISGEGDESIVELCRGQDPANIKGLYFRDGARVAYTGNRDRIADLDSLPFPKYEGFETDRYDTRSMNILSSRGCPYSCTYCTVKLVVGRRFLKRSPPKVIDEIEYWCSRGYRVFNFSDDCFNLDRERVHAICQGIIKKGLRIELNAPNGIRADRADRESLLLMKEAGFRHISFGVEAGNSKVLANLKKGESIEKIELAIRNACELGHEVGLYFLIGSPGEDLKDIEDSFNLAQRYPVVDVRFYNLVPYPNTDLYTWIEQNNYFVASHDEYFNGNMWWSTRPVFRTPELDVAQREAVYARGLKLGDKLRRRQLLEYYKRGFKKFGLLSPPIAYLASSNAFQFVLKRSSVLNNLRVLLKQRGVFAR